jgi:hypothetical protein
MDPDPQHCLDVLRGAFFAKVQRGTLPLLFPVPGTSLSFPVMARFKFSATCFFVQGTMLTLS